MWVARTGVITEPSLEGTRRHCGSPLPAESEADEVGDGVACELNNEREEEDLADMMDEARFALNLQRGVEDFRSFQVGITRLGSRYRATSKWLREQDGRFYFGSPLQ